MAIYLFNPINGMKEKTTYELLSGITGMSKSSLRCYKSRMLKIKAINEYLIDDIADPKVLKNILQNEVIKDEIWRYIEGYNGVYEVSNYGRVRKGSKIMIQDLGSTKEFLRVRLLKDGKRKECRVSRLVANAFIEKEFQSQNIVFHKNGNIHDNHADNLEWIRRKDIPRKQLKRSRAISIAKIDTFTGEILDEYDSMREACRENYMGHSTLWEAIRKRDGISCGYKWEIIGG